MNRGLCSSLVPILLGGVVILAVYYRQETAPAAHPTVAEKPIVIARAARCRVVAIQNVREDPELPEIVWLVQVIADQRMYRCSASTTKANLKGPMWFSVGDEIDLEWKEHVEPAKARDKGTMTGPVNRSLPTRTADVWVREVK